MAATTAAPEEQARIWEEVAKERTTTIYYLAVVVLLLFLLWGLAENNASRYARLEIPLRVHTTMHYKSMCETRAERGDIDLVQRDRCIRDAKARANEEI